MTGFSCTQNELTATITMSAAQVAERTGLHGALDAPQLHSAEDKSFKHSKGVHPNGQPRMHQGRKIHCPMLMFLT